MIGVAPLDFRTAGPYVANLPAAERAVVYGTLGGSPLYLEQWDPDVDRRSNLVRLFGNAISPLVRCVSVEDMYRVREVLGLAL